MPKTKRDDVLFTPAGDFRQDVTLLINSSSNATLGTRGEVSYGSTTAVSLKASIETLGGSEGLFVRQMFPTASHRVTLRYDSRVTPATRVTFGTETLHILSVANVEERGRDVVLVCGREV